MSNNETWIEEAEKITLFDSDDEGSRAGKLLEISPTNRTIAGKDQASLLSGIRMAANYYGKLYPDTERYQWINNLADVVEQYQLTLEGEQNSRRQFMRVQISKFMSRIFARSKNVDIQEISGA